MAHERSAICKSQLEAIIKKPGNTWVVGTNFWSLICRRTLPGFSFVCNAGYIEYSSQHNHAVLDREVGCNTLYKYTRFSVF